MESFTEPFLYMGGLPYVVMGLTDGVLSFFHLSDAQLGERGLLIIE